MELRGNNIGGHGLNALAEVVKSAHSLKTYQIHLP
jgi:hypothetical protein